MTFTHNQKVKCTINGKKIDDARISINKDGREYICQNIFNGFNAADKLGYEYSCLADGNGVADLRPAVKSFDDLEVGDEVKDEFNKSHWVMGFADRIIFLSKTENKDICDLVMTKERLILLAYTIVQDEPADEVKEMTVKDVEALVGCKVKIIKE